MRYSLECTHMHMCFLLTNLWLLGGLTKWSFPRNLEPAHVGLPHIAPDGMWVSMTTGLMWLLKPSPAASPVLCAGCVTQWKINTKQCLKQPPHMCELLVVRTPVLPRVLLRSMPRHTSVCFPWLMRITCASNWELLRLAGSGQSGSMYYLFVQHTHTWMTRPKDAACSSNNAASKRNRWEIIVGGNHEMQLNARRSGLPLGLFSYIKLNRSYIVCLAIYYIPDKFLNRLCMVDLPQRPCMYRQDLWIFQLQQTRIIWQQTNLSKFNSRTGNLWSTKTFCPECSNVKRQLPEKSLSSTVLFSPCHASERRQSEGITR